MTDVSLFCLCLWTLFGFECVFGIECVSVTEGDSVTLSVNLTDTQRNEGIKWKFGSAGIVIAEITDEGQNITVYKERADGRFRDRLKINKHTGSLTITNITDTHSGLYQVINTNTGTQINIFNITVYVTGSDYILPLSCAAGSLMILTAVLIFCICRKQRKTHQDETGEQEITYADPTFYTRQTHKQRGVPVEDEVVYAGVMRR